MSIAVRVNHQCIKRHATENSQPVVVVTNRQQTKSPSAELYRWKLIFEGEIGCHKPRVNCEWWSKNAQGNILPVQVFCTPELKY
jgi:hypothetical protein